MTAWGAALNGLAFEGGAGVQPLLDSFVDNWPLAANNFLETVACLELPPDGTGVPALRTADATLAFRDGVTFGRDYYENRIVTLQVTVGGSGCVPCANVRRTVQRILSAWGRECGTVPLYLFTDCEGEAAEVGPYAILGRPRAATVQWERGNVTIAHLTLRFDAMDHRIFVTDPEDQYRWQHEVFGIEPVNVTRQNVVESPYALLDAPATLWDITNTGVASVGEAFVESFDGPQPPDGGDRIPGYMQATVLTAGAAGSKTLTCTASATTFGTTLPAGETVRIGGWVRSSVDLPSAIPFVRLLASGSVLVQQFGGDPVALVAGQWTWVERLAPSALASNVVRYEMQVSASDGGNGSIVNGVTVDFTGFLVESTDGTVVSPLQAWFDPSRGVWPYPDPDDEPGQRVVWWGESLATGDDGTVNSSRSVMPVSPVVEIPVTGDLCVQPEFVLIGPLTGPIRIVDHAQAGGDAYLQLDLSLASGEFAYIYPRTGRASVSLSGAETSDATYALSGNVNLGFQPENGSAWVSLVTGNPADTGTLTVRWSDAVLGV